MQNQKLVSPVLIMLVGFSMSIQSEIKPISQVQTKKSFYGALLADCKPYEVWHFFEEISQIPRGSGNEKAVGDFVANIAKSKQLEVVRDSIGNVIVRKPASSERYAKSPMITLQSHLDMVCEKNNDVTHDFTKDPIKLVRQGKYLGAAGTTLGADNGVGVAMMLSLMTSHDLVHGPLEFLFTVNEEMGFDGARNLTPASLKGRILCNLDSEELGAFFVGCAGGCETVGHVPVKFEPLENSVKGFKIAINGLKGGHSGADIHLGRVNSLKLLSQILVFLETYNGRLVSLEGGNKRNAIPRYAEAMVAVTNDKEKVFVNDFKQFGAMLAEQNKAIEPNLALTITPVDQPKEAMKIAHQRTITNLLAMIPHGVIKMSADIESLVETSSNLARVSLEKESHVVVFETSQRSLVAEEKQKISQTVVNHMKRAGAEVVAGGGYPGWKPELNSPTLQTAQKTYERLFGEKPAVKAIHAGLECGQIGERIPGMDMISFGPSVIDAHSPDERVDTETVGIFWKFLTNFLADMVEK